MKYIVILSGLVYIISLMDTTNTFLSFLAFQPQLILRGQIWRLVTWLLYPSGSNILLVALTLYFYYFIGSTLENSWSTGRFTIYYICGVLLNVIYGFVIYLITGIPIGLSPSYLNLSMFFSFAVLYPDHQVLLFFIIPVKMKWLAILDAIIFAADIIQSCLASQWLLAFMPLIPILNFFIFCGDDLIYLLRRTKFGSTNSNTIKFKSAARKAKANQDKAAAKTPSGTTYRHKCCVCGRNDADNPSLEFRYCSRCAGYHCYCMDHINNHVHFTD